MNDLSPVKVSFIIPARNEERFVGACIDSLQKQAVDFPCEIVVVDNGSSDATAVAATRQGARVVHEPRAGLANARQAGLEAARGEYVVYVDADSRLPEQWTSEVIARFDREPQLVAASTAFTFYDGRMSDNAGNRLFRTILTPATNFVLRACGQAEILIGSGIVVRTAALRRVNGVDLDFQFYGEDTIMACRLHTQGDVRFWNSPLYQTSARRYQQRGLLSVVFRYFSIFALIHLGRTVTALRLAREFQERDRRGRRPTTGRPVPPPVLPVGLIASDALLAGEEIGGDVPAFAPDGQVAPL